MATGVKFENIMFVGSSAGATLALLAIERQLREAAHVGLPAGVVAFSPWALEIPLKANVEDWDSWKQYKDKDGTLIHPFQFLLAYRSINQSIDLLLHSFDEPKNLQVLRIRLLNTQNIPSYTTIRY